MVQRSFNVGLLASPARIIWRFHSRIRSSKKRGLLPRQRPQRRSIRMRLQYITERNSKRDRLPDIPLHRLWRPADTGEVTFVGLRSVAQQNLLIASNGTEYLVLPITAEQGHHLAQHQRGITLTISSAVTIQAHVQGLER